MRTPMRMLIGREPPELVKLGELISSPREGVFEPLKEKPPRGGKMRDLLSKEEYVQWSLNSYLRDAPLPAQQEVLNEPVWLQFIDDVLPLKRYAALKHSGEVTILSGSLPSGSGYHARRTDWGPWKPMTEFPKKPGIYPLRNYGAGAYVRFLGDGWGCCHWDIDSLVDVYERALSPWGDARWIDIGEPLRSDDRVVG